MVYEENPMSGQSAPRPGVALIISLLRLRCGDEQHPAWSLAVIFFSVAPNTTCSTYDSRWEARFPDAVSTCVWCTSTLPQTVFFRNALTA